MVLLIIFSAICSLSTLILIWWCIYCYSNWLVATFFTILLVATLCAIIYTTIMQPTQQEINDHIRKSLNV